MSLPEDASPSVPFSLACEECDGGMEIGSYEEALASGWTGIVFAPELPTANYLGLCPDCRRREEAEQLQRAAVSRPAVIESPTSSDSTFSVQGESIMAKDANKPVHEIRLGRIKAAVWENETQSGTRHNVTFQRIYRDDAGQWNTSDSFGRDDLPLVAKVADLAHTWIFQQGQSGGEREERKEAAGSRF